MELGIKINRNLDEGNYNFNSVFSGFSNLDIVKKIFGEKTEKVLDKLQVIIVNTPGYLYVDDTIGAIVVSKNYLRTGKETYLYLDVIHELVHIRQFIEGKELFDTNFSYVERPTEIEAYKITVEEARRIGLSEKEIADYLKVEWISKEEWRKLLNNVGVKTKL